MPPYSTKYLLLENCNNCPQAFNFACNDQKFVVMITSNKNDKSYNQIIFVYNIKLLIVNALTFHKSIQIIVFTNRGLYYYMQIFFLLKQIFFVNLIFVLYFSFYRQSNISAKYLQIQQHKEMQQEQQQNTQKEKEYSFINYSKRVFGLPTRDIVLTHYLFREESRKI